MMSLVLNFYEMAQNALDDGANMDALVNLPVREQIGRVKYLAGDELESQLEAINRRLAAEIGDVKEKGGAY
jgi:V/A-type H+-transporting ATPase subunit A